MALWSLNKWCVVGCFFVVVIVIVAVLHLVIVVVFKDVTTYTEHK